MLSLWSCFRHVWQPVLLDRSATRKMSVLTSFTLRSRSVSWPSMPCVRCSLAFFHLWSLMFWGSSLMASDKAYNLRRFLACQQLRELKQFKTETWGCRWMQVIAIAIRIGLAAHLVYWNALGHFHPHCSLKQTVGRAIWCRAFFYAQTSGLNIGFPAAHDTHWFWPCRPYTESEGFCWNSLV